MAFLKPWQILFPLIPFSKREVYINYCSNRAKNRHERSRACHGNNQPTSQTRRFSFSIVHYWHRTTQFWNKMHGLHFTCYHQLSLRVVDKTKFGWFRFACSLRTECKATNQNFLGNSQNFTFHFSRSFFLEIFTQ